MTKIAIISDIHGNQFALDAVIADITTRKVDEVLVGGDMVGRGPQGTAVVDAIQRCGWRSVRGNHEEYLIAFREKKVDPEWLKVKAWAASRWMAAELSEGAYQFIKTLPFSLRSEKEKEVILFHGTPRSNCEGLGVWSEDALLRETLFSEDCEVMLVAHTHRAYSWRLEERLLVNVGSVGLPFNGNQNAQYTIIEKTQVGWKVKFIEVVYDMDAFLKYYESSGFLKEGGITAYLLREEIKRARYFLVPFQRWIRLLGIKESHEEMEAFLSWYDCSKTSEVQRMEFIERAKVYSKVSQ